MSDNWASLTGWIDEKLGLSKWAAGAWDGIKTAWSSVKGLVSDNWASLTGWIDEKLGLSKWASGAWDTIKTAWGDAKTLVSDTWASLTGAIDQKLGISKWASGVWESIKGAFSGVESYFSDLFTKAVGAIEGAFSGIGTWFETQWYNIRKGAVDAINSLIYAYNDTIGKVTGQIDPIVIDVHVGDDLRGREGILKAKGKEASDSLAAGMQAGSAEVSKAAGDVTGAAADAAAAQGEAFEDVGAEFMSHGSRGVLGNQDELTGAAKSAVEQAAAAAKSSSGGGGGSAGMSLAQGLAAGMRAGVGQVAAAAAALGNAALSALRENLQIHSPSRAFAYLGEMSAEGYAEGLRDNLSGSLAAIGQMGAMAMHAVSGASPAAAQTDYARLGDAVADAMERRGLGSVDLYVDGEKLGESTERGASKASYRRMVGSVKGRAAAMRG